MGRTRGTPTRLSIFAQQSLSEFMQHIITLSGNSKRFTDAELPHKALCEIAQQPLISHFIDSFENFHQFDTIFLCRKEDLSSTNLGSIIKKYAPLAKIAGIDTNNLGPVYSILQIRDLIEKGPVFVSYIDTLQRLDLKELDKISDKYDGGIIYHNFENPHWRTNKSYCLVRFNGDLATEILEKYNFNGFDFSVSDCGGSSGGYYFTSSEAMLLYFDRLISLDRRVNNEFYVTQALQLMVEDNKSIQCIERPYVSLGTPEDLSDYKFWEKWFNKNKE